MNGESPCHLAKNTHGDQGILCLPVLCSLKGWNIMIFFYLHFWSPGVLLFFWYVSHLFITGVEHCPEKYSSCHTHHRLTPFVLNVQRSKTRHAHATDQDLPLHERWPSGPPWTWRRLHPRYRLSGRDVLDFSQKPMTLGGSCHKLVLFASTRNLIIYTIFGETQNPHLKLWWETQTFYFPTLVVIYRDWPEGTVQKAECLFFSSSGWHF